MVTDPSPDNQLAFYLLQPGSRTAPITQCVGLLNNILCTYIRRNMQNRLYFEVYGEVLYSK